MFRGLTGGSWCQQYSGLGTHFGCKDSDVETEMYLLHRSIDGSLPSILNILPYQNQASCITSLNWLSPWRVDNVARGLFLVLTCSRENRLECLMWNALLFIANVIETWSQSGPLSWKDRTNPLDFLPSSYERHYVSPGAVRFSTSV
jgi:hypothetical protein